MKLSGGGEGLGVAHLKKAVKFKKKKLLKGSHLRWLVNFQAKTENTKKYSYYNNVSAIIEKFSIWVKCKTRPRQSVLNSWSKI